MNIDYLEKYAEFAVRSGVNVQKGQTLIIRAPIHGAEFARMCAEEAYAAGAKEVVMQYNDEKFSRIKMMHTDVAVLEDVKPWQLASFLDYTEKEGDLCTLVIIGEDPEIYKGIDSEKIDRASRARSKAMRQWMDMTMGNQVQWSIVAIPSKAWATKVFPKDNAQDAVQKLWDAIFVTARVEGGNPVAAWDKHVKEVKENAKWLQELALESLHFKADNGTDLVVGLADGHMWKGAGDDSTTGVPFLPNIPTEEVFTAPHRLRTNGVVKTSLPYVYNGNLIEGISVRFKEGVVVEYSAESGTDLLEQMMSADDGAKHIGEVALVPATSPIRKTGVLFYNTLFDENAACHIAFGAAYPDTVENGGSMTKEQQLSAGLNDSIIHEDVMIGTEDMEITGKTKDGKTVQIFKNGVWAER